MIVTITDCIIITHVQHVTGVHTEESIFVWPDNNTDT